MSRTPMKLILTQEVSGLGAPGDVVDVAPGYGRNYLIPRGFAMSWTRGVSNNCFRQDSAAANSPRSFNIWPC